MNGLPVATAKVHPIDVLGGDVLVEDGPWLLFIPRVTDLLQVLGDVFIMRLDLVGDPGSISADG